MPPRSARKASAKKSSPKVKKTTPVGVKPSPVVPPSVPEEEEVQEVEAPRTVTAEEKVGEATFDAEERVVEPEEKKVRELEKDLDADAILSTEVDEEKATREEAVPSDAVEEAKVPKTEEVEESNVPLEKVKESEASSSKVAEIAEGVKGLEGLVEIKESNDVPNEIIVEQGVERNLLEEGTVASKVEDAEGHEAGDGVEDVDKSESDDDCDHEENEEEDDTSVYMQAPLTERKKQKEFEIFVGGLDKEAVEDDLIKFFGAFGEIQSARVVKHPLTQKSKGFAFIRYATIEQAKKVLAELKDGVEIRGKRVGISASMDNDTLYLGNICKTWTKDHVLETLKGFGVEHIEEVLLPDDPENEGKSKGFALMEFNSHSEAMAAFQRLRKPDAVFGCNKSAKVSFAPSSIHPSEEALSQVKTVFIEGLPLSWDEEKVKELCKQYGEVDKVQLSRNFTKNKRKDYGFVSFISRESVLACVQGINDAQLGEGEVKVKANLAKPQNKGRLAKQSARGGFEVKKVGEGSVEADQSKLNSQPKSKETHWKGKVVQKLKGSKGSKKIKSKGKPAGGKSGAQDRQKMELPFKNQKRNGRETGTNSVPSSKKARNNRNFGNVQGRPSNGLGNQRNASFGKPKASYIMHPTTYASGYAAPSTSYQGHAYAGASGSKRHYSDMEPHAGYLPAAKQSRNPYGYAQGRAGGYDSQPRSADAYAGGSVLQTSYPGYSSYAGYEAGYVYPSSGAYAPQGPYY